jgi:hypothetical protein
MEQNNLQDNKKEPIVIENTNAVLGYLEKGLRLIKEYGISRILTGAVVIALLSIVFYFLFNPTKAFEVYSEWETSRHHKLMELRMDNTPKIQTLIDKLTYRVDASRVLLLELHNGNTSNGGIPFTKCSATFEGLNIGTYPVANQYQNQNLSLIPFASYIFEKGYWCGNTDDLLNIDKALYYKMKSNKTDHFAACVIEGIDKPLAILIVSFETPHENEVCNNVRENIRHICLELAVLMEVEFRTGKTKH